MNKEKLKIVPEIRFPKFENDGNWKSEPLGEFSDVSKLAGYEFTKHIVYEDKGKIIALRGLNIKNNKLDLTNVKYIDNSELSKLGRSKLYVDDLMFTYIGTIGEVALIEENDKYYLAPNVSRIRLNKEIVSPNFILQYFNTANFKKIEVAKYISSSSQPALTMGNVRKFSIALPPSKEEQQKIANCLSSLDNLITAETEKLDHLKDHKKGLLQQLFPAKGETKPQFRFPEFKNDGDWIETTLGDIGKPLMCKRILKEQTSTDSNNSIPFYKIGTFGKIADAYIPISLYQNFKSRYSFPNIGEILISASGTIGRLVVYNGDDAYFQDSNIVWLGHNEDDIINPFLYYCYLTLNWQTSDGGVIKRLYNNNLKEMVIYYPNNKIEQKKIANCLSSADNLIEAQKIKIKALKDHKKGLMQQLFPNSI